MAKARAITGIDAHATTAKNARLIARTRLEELHQWGRYADESQRVQELHNLRIAAKRLRYTLELFADVLPSESGVMLEEITKVQEELGTLHDADVMIALVRQCLNPVEGDKNDKRDKGDKNVSTQHSQQLSSNLARPTMKDGEQEEAEVSQSLVASLVTVRGTLTNRERSGLEELVGSLQRRREEYYEIFQRHWHQLQERDFSKALSHRLEM